MLCVGGETTVHDQLSRQFEDQTNISLIAAETATEAQTRLERAGTQFDGLVSTYSLPDENGIELLQHVRSAWPALPFVLVTDTGSESVASSAIQYGVTDYIPVTSLEAIDEYSERIEAAVTTLRNRGHTANERTWERPNQRTGEQTSNASGTTADRKILEQLRDITKSTSDLFWIFSGDWTELKYINNRAREIWGCSVETVQSETSAFVDTAHPADRNAIEQWMETLASGQSDTIEYRVEESGNRERWVRSYGNPIPDETGTVDRIAGYS